MVIRVSDISSDGRVQHSGRLALDGDVEEARLRRVLLHLVDVVQGVVGGPRVAAEVVLQPLGGLLFARLFFDVEVEGLLGEGVLAVKGGGRSAVFDA